MVGVVENKAPTENDEEEEKIKMDVPGKKDKKEALYQKASEGQKGLVLVAREDSTIGNFRGKGMELRYLGGLGSPWLQKKKPALQKGASETSHSTLVGKHIRTGPSRPRNVSAGELTSLASGKGAGGTI